MQYPETSSSLSIHWTEPSMTNLAPTARGGHSMVLTDTQLILFGGHYFGRNDKNNSSEFTYLSDTHVLELTTSTWHTVTTHGATLPVGRYNHSASLIGDRMFIFGGRGAGGRILNDLFFLDLKDFVWYQIHVTSESPPGRFDHASCIVGTTLVIHGGWDGKKSFGDTWVFHTETFTWSLLHPHVGEKRPAPRHGHTLTRLPHSKRLVLFGGYTVTEVGAKSPTYHADTWMFETDTHQWSRPRVTGEFPVARFDHSVVVVEETLLVIGGWAGTEKGDISVGDGAAPKIRQRSTKSRKSDTHVDSSSPLPGQSSRFINALQTSNLGWESPLNVGAPIISNRYGHTTTLVGSNLFIFGGWDGRRAMNELFVGEVFFMNDDTGSQASL